MALATLAILSFSPFFAFFTLEARPYVVIALFGSLNLNSYFSLSERPHSLRRLLLWSLSSLAFVFSQYLAVLFLGIEGLFLVIRNPRHILRYLLAAIVPVELAGAWFSVSYAHQNHLLAEVAWLERPGAMEFIWFYVGSIGEDAGISSTILVALLCLPALSFAWSRLAARRLASHEAFVALLAFGIPVLVFVISVLGPKPVFAARQLFVSALCFVLLIGMAVETLPRGAATAVAVSLLLWSAVALARQPPTPQFSPWRELAGRVDSIAGPAPLLTVEPSMALYLAYYRRTGEARPILSAATLRGATTLFVACRPFKCQELQDPGLANRLTLLGDWKWGTPNANQATREMRLYRLSPAES